MFASLSCLMIGGIITSPSMAIAADGDPLQDGKSYYMARNNGKAITTRVDTGADWKRWDYVKTFDRYICIHIAKKSLFFL